MVVLYISLLDDGERQVSDRLYKEYRQVMFKAAYDILKDASLAEDAVHNAFEHIAGHLYKLSDIKSVGTKAYLLIVVKNDAKKIYNKRKPLQDCVDITDNEYLLPEAENTENEVIKRLSKQRIFMCLSEMSPKYRDVLLMKYYFGHNDKVIAAALGINVDAVRKRLERARKEMTMKYRGDDGEE